MADTVTEYEKVISKIRDSNAANYKVLTNLGKEQHYIGNMFPDLILFEKDGDKPVFIIEVKRNGQIAQCIQQWKSVPNIPATLYIVVPEEELQNAKTIGQIVGLKNRFGTYNLDGDNIKVHYE